MKKLVVTLMTAVVLFSACINKSLNDKFNPQSYKEDIAIFIKNKLLSESDKALIFSYIEKMNEANTAITGTYSDVLNDAKHIEELRTIVKNKNEEGQQLAKMAIDEIYNKPVGEREIALKEFAKTFNLDLKDQQIDVNNRIKFQQLINGKILDDVIIKVTNDEKEYQLNKAKTAIENMKK